MLEISAIVRRSHKMIRDSEMMVLPLSSISEDNAPRIVNFSLYPWGDSSSQRPTGGLLRLDREAAAVACELRNSAQRFLPAYMVPSLFLIVAHFPKTSSAKIDRAALTKALSSLYVKKWEAAQRTKLSNDPNQPGDTHVAKSEAQLRTLVSRLCNLEEDHIGHHTPLPSLGLDSIKAILLARQLSELELPISVVDIVTHPTLAALAEKIDQSHLSLSRQATRLAESQSRLPEFDERIRVQVALHIGLALSSVDQVLPCTPSQEGMLAETL